MADSPFAIGLRWFIPRTIGPDGEGESDLNLLTESMDARGAGLALEDRHFVAVRQRANASLFNPAGTLGTMIG